MLDAALFSPMKKRSRKTKRIRRSLPSTIAKQVAFLRAYVKAGGIVHPACLAAKISRQTHYNWLENDPAYAREFEHASKEAIMPIRRFAALGVIKGAQEGDSLCLEFIKNYWGESVLERILRGENVINDLAA